MEKNNMLIIVICCDTDPDFPYVPDSDIKPGMIHEAPPEVEKKELSKRMKAGRSSLSWTGVERGIPQFMKLAESFNNLKVTWFLRSDWMMWKVYGDWAWPMNNYSDIWKKLEKQGHEIGWHPHLHRKDEKSGYWYQETDDKVWIETCLKTGYREIKKTGRAISCMKMGWDFHNNFTMALSSELGLESDFSANPDMKSIGHKDVSGKYFINVYDWTKTPDHPYFPSKLDYRISAKDDKKNHNIIEMPITVHSGYRSLRIPIILSKKIYSKLRNRKVVIRQPFTLNSNIEVFHKGLIETALKPVGCSPRYIIMDFHPYELFDQDEFDKVKRNLNSIYEVSDKLGLKIKCMTASELAHLYKSAMTKGD